MRGLMCRAAVVAGAAVVLLGLAVGVASAAGGAAATAAAQSQQSQNQKLPRYSLTVLGTLAAPSAKPVAESTTGARWPGGPRCAETAESTRSFGTAG